MKSDSAVTKQELGLHHFRLAKQHTQMAQYHHDKYQKLKKSKPRSKVGLVKRETLMGYHHTERARHLESAKYSLGYVAKHLPNTHTGQKFSIQLS